MNIARVRNLEAVTGRRNVALRRAYNAAVLLGGGDAPCGQNPQTFRCGKKYATQHPDPENCTYNEEKKRCVQSVKYKKEKKKTKKRRKEKTNDKEAKHVSTQAKAKKKPNDKEAQAKGVPSTNNDMEGVTLDAKYPPFKGKWELNEQIGSGTQGTMYKAHDDYNKKVAAIKVQKTSWEHRMYMILYSPTMYPRGLPKVGKSLIKTRGEYAYVMEYMGGGTLLTHRTKDRTKDVIRKLVGSTMELIEVLEYVHDKGIVHRDVNPNNIMYTTENYVKLIDFGAAFRWTAYKPNKRKGGLVGTPAFVSRHVLAGFKPTRRDDMYSLGLSIMHVVDLLPSWARDEDGGIASRMKQQEADFPDGSQSELRTACVQMMRLNHELDFDARPDYTACKKLFSHLAV